MGSTQRRFTALVSFEKPDGTPVEMRRIFIGAASEEEAIDIATGVAVILSAGRGVGSVDSITAREGGPACDVCGDARHPVLAPGYTSMRPGDLWPCDHRNGGLTLEQAIVWALTVGQPGDRDESEGGTR